ncbi:DUF433 domain-containing protein [Bradyrhizobium sacchari]|uniref:Uncharacterized protein DUF433 n=1 Tax=Bradyrhizobium sacchari TaxID=1399419 RepID=A0A560KK13_9BRAD|nr:DUF433 domain-containing protein [Bradyrhizobium sacchari]TWB66331.1 uncharacterized protein DUF433 [Bradyrhizobium sacchari]TWB83568.1 uncharacterized protein DUF433 [Bradyrhizobium sacchari]
MRHERTEINPAIMMAGTRVLVELVLRELGASMTTEAIIAEHPRLAPDDIRAAQLLRPMIWPMSLQAWSIRPLRRD